LTTPKSTTTSRLEQKELFLPSDFSKIILTEDETKEAIANGISIKQQQIFREIKNELYIRKLRTEPERKHMTINEYYNFVDDRAAQASNLLTFEGDNERIFSGLMLHFCGDNRAKDVLSEFTQEQYSPQKGILLIGGTGCGKTTLLRLFQLNPLFSFNIVSAKEISNQYSINGFEIFSKYCCLSSTKGTMGTKYNPFNQLQFGIGFDDIGAEIIGQNFGQKVEVISEIIELLYNQKDLIPFFAINGTSNLSLSELEKRYGSRFFDRLIEMSNIIIINSESHRK
jgi:DNA replication protein DnaC